jgi:signal transduction histidine kinase
LYLEASQQLEGDITENIYADIDENAVRMIIDNLLENATKYSEKGTTTTASIVKRNDVIEIAIADEGVGVSEPDRLFKKFSRIKNDLSTKVGGTGIGLYWAQSIARLHGGDLRYEANLPHGSIFILSLPTVK